MDCALPRTGSKPEIHTSPRSCARWPITGIHRDWGHLWEGGAVFRAGDEANGSGVVTESHDSRPTPHVVLTNERFPSQQWAGGDGRCTPTDPDDGPDQEVPSPLLPQWGRTWVVLLFNFYNPFLGCTNKSLQRKNCLFVSFQTRRRQGGPTTLLYLTSSSNI